LSFYEGTGVGVLKIEELKLEVLCTDSTALVVRFEKRIVYSIVFTDFVGLFLCKYLVKKMSLDQTLTLFMLQWK
jgi:hypothetical protein